MSNLNRIVITIVLFVIAIITIPMILEATALPYASINVNSECIEWTLPDGSTQACPSEWKDLKYYRVYVK